MLRQISIGIIILILIYQLYCNLKKPKILISDLKEENETFENSEKIKNFGSTCSNLKNKQNTEHFGETCRNLQQKRKIQNTEVKEKKVVENYAEGTSKFKNDWEDLGYGKPHNTLINENKKYVYIWKFDNPNPWSKIIYQGNSNYKYLFTIKLNEFPNDKKLVWEKIIPNLLFNNQELSIPSNDEISAISVINLIVSSIDGKVDFQKIIGENLIELSVKKCKEFPIVKTKLKQQIKKILEKLNSKKNKEKFKPDTILKHNVPSNLKHNVQSNLQHNVPSNLQHNVPKLDKRTLEERQDKNSMERIQGMTNDLEPYGGNEYSFI